MLGRSSSIVYGVALLASGQSSTITGTYAGQYIMQVPTYKISDHKKFELAKGVSSYSMSSYVPFTYY